MAGFSKEGRRIQDKIKIHHLIHVKELGDEWFNFFEINRIHPELILNGDALDNLSKEDIHSIDRNLRRKNLEVTIHGPLTDLSPGSTDEKILEVTRKRLNQALDVAEILRPTIVNFHAGYNNFFHEGEIERWLKISCETWEALAQRAEKISAVITLENVFEKEPSPIKKIIQMVNSPFLRHCFDVGHFHIFQKTSLKKWMTEIGKYVSLIHIHDNHMEKDEHLALGNGNFPFPAFFDMIKELDQEITLTIETFNLGDAKKSLQYLYRYLRA